MRRRKTLPCLPAMSESSWPSKCVFACLCLIVYTYLLWMSRTHRHTYVKVLISFSLRPDRALELPLTDLSFDDREISLSRGPLRIYDYSCLLEFNLLVCRLGWVEGDWIDWSDWVEVEGGRDPRLWVTESEETLTPTGGRAETHRGGSVRITWFYQFKIKRGKVWRFIAQMFCQDWIFLNLPQILILCNQVLYTRDTLKEGNCQISESISCDYLVN